MLGPDSELYKELRAKGAQVGKEVQAPTYWGRRRLLRDRCILERWFVSCLS